MSPTVISTADVATSRAARYGKQLVAHLGRRVGGSWDDDSETGVINFPTSEVRLSCTPAALHLEVTTPEEEANRAEDVVGRHLVRFGTRDELSIFWQRSDGSPGTRQPE